MFQWDLIRKRRFGIEVMKRDEAVFFINHIRFYSGDELLNSDSKEPPPLILAISISIKFLSEGSPVILVQIILSQTRLITDPF